MKETIYTDITLEPNPRTQKTPDNKFWLTINNEAKIFDLPFLQMHIIGWDVNEVMNTFNSKEVKSFSVKFRSTNEF